MSSERQSRKNTRLSDSSVYESNGFIVFIRREQVYIAETSVVGNHYTKLAISATQVCQVTVKFLSKLCNYILLGFVTPKYMDFTFKMQECSGTLKTSVDAF